jgi:hypothetical protein
MTRSAHALFRCTHSMNSSVDRNNGANTAAQNDLRPMKTCFAVPLHKLSRNEPNQNHCYGMQPPCKLKRTTTWSDVVQNSLTQCVIQRF